MKVFWVLLLVQKCQELILHQIFRRLGSVPSVRLRRPWGESLWEASVSFLCLTGLVKFPSPLLVYRWLCCKEFFFFLFDLCFAGFTTISSMRTDSQCTLEAGVPFFSTTKRYHHGFGEALNYFLRATFMHPIWRYDRKDPSSVAISISPEASLMLGKMH